MTKTKDIPIEIVIPILTAAPIIYDTMLAFADMLKRTKQEIENWGEKSDDEKQAALEEASRNFDEKMNRFEQALAEVKAKRAEG